ncbi:hypothetical protein HY634_01430, partial [Candidatus Uhrbacteria bacterium]|nr:hypothetical protein [Candidatus Uhrbacteria bacterium]
GCFLVVLRVTFRIVIGRIVGSFVRIFAFFRIFFGFLILRVVEGRRVGYWSCHRFLLTSAWR